VFVNKYLSLIYVYIYIYKPTPSLITDSICKRLVTDIIDIFVYVYRNNYVT
jgi:hypothetical protein